MPHESRFWKRFTWTIHTILTYLSSDEEFERPPIPAVCYLCAHAILPGETTHCDHIIPKSRGGPSTRSNYAIVHASCNLWKGAKLPSEYWMTRDYRAWFGSPPPWAAEYP